MAELMAILHGLRLAYEHRYNCHMAEPNFGSLIFGCVLVCPRPLSKTGKK